MSSHTNEIETMTSARVEAIKIKADKLIQNTKNILQKEERNSYIEFYKKIKLFVAYTQDEIALHHSKLEVESLDKIWKKFSEEFLESMKTFSLCASVESMSKIMILPLLSDSLQAGNEYCRTSRSYRYQPF